MSKPISVQEPFQPLESTPIPIGAIAFQHLASKPDHKIYSVSLKDIKQALKPKAKTNPATVLPEHYNEFLKVFSYKEANKLPPHRSGVDHTIKMQPGTQPPAGSLYSMSRDGFQVFKKYLEDNLSKGFIWALSLPAATLVLFVKKPGRGLWFCVDYRGLNALTVKNKYPLPLIKNTLERLCKAVYFTKLNIVAVFNKICMAEGEEQKTAFRTRLGLYKYLVMLFGLSNASSSFQNFLNDVLSNDILDIFVIAYMNDILIVSKTLQEHKKHVKTVLGRIQAAGLQLDIDKCKFEVQETKYLRLII